MMADCLIIRMVKVSIDDGNKIMMTMTTFVVTLPSSETIGSIKAIFSRITSRNPY